MCSASAASGAHAVERSDYSALVGRAETPPHPLRGLVTVIASMLSMIFVGVCWFFYWFSAIPAAITALVIPRSVLERHPLFWLSSASIGLACLTQTIDTFFPNYLDPREVLCEVAVWFGIGFLARTYLAYTQIPDTFDGVRAAIASRKIDRWFESVLPNSIDAIFTRIWVGNSIVILPLIVSADRPVNEQLLRGAGLQRAFAAQPVPLRDHRPRQHPQPHLQSEARRLELQRGGR